MRIAALLPRGEAIRTHVYSGVFDRVRDRAAIDAISVVPNDDVWALLEDHFDSVIPLEESPDPWRVRIIREFLETAHGRWLWSEAAKERWRRRDLEAVTTSQRVKRRAKALVAAPIANRPALDALDSMYEFVSNRSNSRAGARKVVERCSPSLVFNGSHVHSRNAEAVIVAARSARIRTATFLFSWDNLTSQGRIIPRYDRYIAWNDQIRDDLLRMHPTIAAANVEVTGTPQFDFHFKQELWTDREAFCAKVGADPSRPIVLYTSGMPNHMPGEPTLVEGIADGLATMSSYGPPQLMVRIYAKDQTARWDGLRERRPDIIFAPVRWETNWLTPLPEDSAIWVNTVRHCDLGINVASTVSLELCILDRPVLNIAYNPPEVPRGQIDYSRYYSFDHYKPVAESGAVVLLTDPAQLVPAVRAALDDPRAASGARRGLLSQMFGDTLDGKAADRVADAILRFAEEP